MEQQEKIFQLYIQRLSGGLSPEEEFYVQRMLAQDAAFRETWDALESRGRSMNAGEYANTLDPQKALADLHKRTSARRRNIRTNLAIAASLLLLVLAGTLWLNRQQPVSLKEFVAQADQPQAVQLTTASGQSVSLDTDSTQRITLSNATLSTSNGALNYTSADTAMNMLAVPPGGQYRLVLSDGTEVHLNAGTRLRFPFHFGGSTREVWVEGEAFFKVAKDPARRFIVHTPRSQVQVYGTSFNVNTYQPEEKTALVEGSVWMQAEDGKRSELKPGYQAVLHGRRFESRPFDEEEVLSWMKGVYYFHRMPVSRLAQEASRFYGVRFVIESDKYAGISTTGLMERTKLSEFLTDLQVTAGAEFRFGDKAIHLR